MQSYTNLLMAPTTPCRAVDNKHFKLYSHEEAEKCGFISKLNQEQDGICLSTPNYPGVALYTTSPLSPEKKKCVGALVQIIPADESVVYSEITAVRGREVTFNMICTTKDTTTPVRFLLGNFFHDKTMFTITDGKNNLVELIIAGQSYTKLPGTIDGKEVLLADTGLKASSVGDMGKRPASGISYKITIGRKTEDPSAYLGTFDNNSLPLMTLNTPPQPLKKWPSFPPPAYKQRPCSSKGGMTAVCSGLSTDGLRRADLAGNDLMTDGEDVTDGAGPPSLQSDGGAHFQEGEISSCVSLVSNMTVESGKYGRRCFQPTATYTLDVHFGKSLYTPPEPVLKAFVPELILCGGGRIFICPHGAHDLSSDLVNIVEQMDCECVADDARKFACLKILTNML